MRFSYFSYFYDENWVSGAWEMLKKLRGGVALRCDRVIILAWGAMGTGFVAKIVIFEASLGDISDDLGGTWAAKAPQVSLRGSEVVWRSLRLAKLVPLSAKIKMFMKQKS